jgi:hypothetical protein
MEMPLADDIAGVRDRALAELDAAHDYYVNTQAAWRIVQRHIARGGRARIRNPATGNLTTERDLPGKAQFYASEYLLLATLQQFVSSFEGFVFDVMRHWLLAFPHKLEKNQVPTVLLFAAPDFDSAKLAVVNHALNEQSYKNVRD